MNSQRHRSFGTTSGIQNKMDAIFQLYDNGKDEEAEEAVLDIDRDLLLYYIFYPVPGITSYKINVGKYSSSNYFTVCCCTFD